MERATGLDILILHEMCVMRGGSWVGIDSFLMPSPLRIPFSRLLLFFVFVVVLRLMSSTSPFPKFVWSFLIVNIPVCLSVCLSVCLLVCFSVYLHLLSSLHF